VRHTDDTERWITGSEHVAMSPFVTAHRPVMSSHRAILWADRVNPVTEVAPHGLSLFKTLVGTVDTPIVSR